MTEPMFVGFMIPRTTFERIMKISRNEAKSIDAVLQLAVEQTSDQGYTDRICVKGRV